MSDLPSAIERVKAALDKFYNEGAPLTGSSADDLAADLCAIVAALDEAVGELREIAKPENVGTGFTRARAFLAKMGGAK